MKLLLFIHVVSLVGKEMIMHFYCGFIIILHIPIVTKRKILFEKYSLESQLINA